MESIISSQKIFNIHLNSLNLESMRSRHKILRIALTLAALDEQAIPDPHHFTEAAYFHPERLGLCA